MKSGGGFTETGGHVDELRFAGTAGGVPCRPALVGIGGLATRGGLEEGVEGHGWRGDGLDEAKKLLVVGDVGEALIAVVVGRFQSVTFCNGFAAFLAKALFSSRANKPPDLRYR